MVIFRQAHYEAAVYFSNRLPCCTYSRRTRTSPTDTTSSTKKTLVYRKGCQFYGRFFRITMTELHTISPRRAAFIDKRFPSTPKFVLIQLPLTYHLILAEQSRASFPVPRYAKSHQVREKAPRTQEA